MKSGRLALFSVRALFLFAVFVSVAVVVVGVGVFLQLSLNTRAHHRLQWHMYVHANRSALNCIRYI